MLIMISMVKKFLKPFMKKNLIKNSLEEKKWVREEISYMSIGKTMIILLIIFILIKKDIVQNESILS